MCMLCVCTFYLPLCVRQLRFSACLVRLRWLCSFVVLFWCLGADVGIDVCIRNLWRQSSHSSDTIRQQFVIGTSRSWGLRFPSYLQGSWNQSCFSADLASEFPYTCFLLLAMPWFFIPLWGPIGNQNEMLENHRGPCLFMNIGLGTI